MASAISVLIFIGDVLVPDLITPLYICSLHALIREVSFFGNIDFVCVISPYYLWFYNDGPSNESFEYILNALFSNFS